MTAILSRKSYRQVCANLKKYHQQHIEDRQESPTALPMSWGIPLRHMIERVVRENKERVYPKMADQVLEYLVEKGLLVRYLNDYTFPSSEQLPTKQEVIESAERFLKGITRDSQN
jgi:hypothetical protein